MTERKLFITQGEFAVADDPGTVISTILGSCVSCCLWDPHAGVGGMNHMLVAQDPRMHPAQSSEGINDMELLINALIRLGAHRSRLVAKAFGGGQMIKGLSRIGSQNSDFAVRYLARENIPLLVQSFGGPQARNLRFWPATGRVLQKLTNETVQEEASASRPIKMNGVELF